LGGITCDLVPGPTVKPRWFLEGFVRLLSAYLLHHAEHRGRAMEAVRWTKQAERQLLDVQNGQAAGNLAYSLQELIYRSGYATFWLERLEDSNQLQVTKLKYKAAFAIFMLSYIITVSILKHLI
jgi:hypothetical protein